MKEKPQAILLAFW